VQVYSDNGVSGAKGRSQRPGLDALLKDASRGRFDVVLAWALDRLGRSLMDLLDTLSELEAVGVALVLHQQAIDTTHQRDGCSSRSPAPLPNSSGR
jgi:DNA invertase Pin-like site-specific DNA recombinase